MAIDRVPPTAVGETILVNNDPVDIPEWLLVLNETTGAVDVTNVARVPTDAQSYSRRRWQWLCDVHR